MELDLGVAPPPDIDLRDYQEDALNRLRSGIRSGMRRQMLCSPTGSGKTHISAALMNEARKKGSRIAFIADRIALVDQTCMRLDELGIPHGVAQGQNRRGHEHRIHVWSSQTLEKAFDHGNKLEDYDLIVIDEGHIIRRKVVENMLKANTCAVALSATPFTKGLGDIYQRVVNVRSTDQLTDDGWLVPLRIFFGTPIDMDGAETAGGEWTDSAVEQRSLKVVGDVVTDWQEHTQKVCGGPVKTIGFSASVAAGADFCRQFAAAGVRVAQLSYRDKDDDERREKIAAFRSNDLDMLWSVGILERGFDVPDVRCLIMARPFRRSVAAVEQQIGRVRRPAPDKDFALVMDHGENLMRFASRLEPFWRDGLNTLHEAKLEQMRKPGDAKEGKDRKCEGCGFMLPKGATACPSCGRTMPSKKGNEAVVAGKMQEYNRSIQPASTFDRDIWPDCCAYAAAKRPDDPEKARKYALMQYKELMGRWPEWGRGFEPAADCAQDVASAIRANVSNWIKRNAWRKKAGAA